MEAIKMIHILYSGLGGTMEYVFNLIRGDYERKHQHEIIFYGVEKINADSLKFAKTICHAVHSIQKKPGFDKTALKALKKHICDSKTKVITLHVNSLIYPVSKYKSKKTKLVFIEHQSNKLKQKREWLWSAIAQKKADHIISFTPKYKAELKKKLSLFFTTRKNTIINTGIPLEDYLKTKRTEKEKINIGIISRINAFRDHETLLNAFSELDKDLYSLHIAGNGPLLAPLQQRFRQDNIKWYGHINREAIINLLSSLDIYVIASLGESTSIALMQAQASGLPIIASDVTGINNVLSPENAILIPPKNKGEMLVALNSLLKNPEKRAIYSEKSKHFAMTNLDNKTMFKSLEQLIS